MPTAKCEEYNISGLGKVISRYGIIAVRVRVEILGKLLLDRVNIRFLRGLRESYC